MHRRTTSAALRVDYPGTLALAAGLLLVALLARPGAVSSDVAVMSEPGATAARDGARSASDRVPVVADSAARMVAEIAAGDRRDGGVEAESPSVESRATAPSPTQADRGCRARVRVTVRLIDPDPSAQGAPAPELLRREADGRFAAVPGPPATRRGPRALALAAAGGSAENSHTFEVDAPGRYVPAWSHWVRTPGTNGWRVVRGTGAEFDVVAHQPMREVVVDVTPLQLVVDPALDRTNPGATYRITPKDG